ncbi:MAG TPA: LL-diaminopimelate aminotransferase [Dictyoglomaceae bacterium]|nr:LL-diaminopimelate aminotransferase [Dictyoglomaceae bacterium]HOL38739.1 LL-diaminopimelate aminotransferase [Dictyoglomaceae bacterium]HPP15512.1 LL-diaminopimelate aminotransferase [Dictyoglomaceae bacterium]HPU43079.1 LL-diaminopimelate aminotransferase [Dictyoglomaceae bacterium]
MIKKAKRIEKLPPYLFARIDQLKEDAIKRGIDIISLGIGDPDQPTPMSVVQKLCEEALNPANHRYPSYEGLYEYRKAVSDWYKYRFNVELDPKSEVLSLIGSKEGLVHIIWGLIDKGDGVLYPDPGYPVYKIATIFAEGTPYSIPLTKENKFLPKWEDIPTNIVKKSKVMFLNYPSNPTGAIIDKKGLEEAVAFAKENNLVLLYDNAYSEITFDGFVAPSILEVKGAKDIAVEFGSLSKTFNMTGWRIGYAVGNADLISILSTIKTNVDSGVFQAIQYAGIEALTNLRDFPKESVKIYQRRRDMVLDAFKSLGVDILPPKGTFYVWVPVPEGFTSTDFSAFLLEETGVLVVPGIGYGDYGEGYIRISTTIEEDRLKEALRRIKEFLEREDWKSKKPSLLLK